MKIIESTRITAPGLYRMPAAAYHKNPCPSIAASSSVLYTLITKSALHAKHKFDVETNPNAAMDFGSATHKLVLGAGNELCVIQCANYLTKDAKEQRDAARARNEIPILAHQYEVAQALAAPLREALANAMGYPVDDCHRELVVCWQESGAWCRAMLDCVSPDFRTIVDLKSTGTSVAPREVERLIYSKYDIQAAFYPRGLDALMPEDIGRRKFYFLFGEDEAPFAIGPPTELDQAGADMASEKVDFALKYWRACVESNVWPGYGFEPAFASPPPWILQQWAAGVVAGLEQMEQIEGANQDSAP